MFRIRFRQSQPRAIDCLLQLRIDQADHHRASRYLLAGANADCLHGARHAARDPTLGGRLQYAGPLHLDGQSTALHGGDDDVRAVKTLAGA